MDPDAAIAGPRRSLPGAWIRTALLVLLAMLAPMLSTAAAQDGAFLLGPPAPRPVAVQAAFTLQDVNAIDDVAETFEFAGVLTLSWTDPRRAFDPAEAGTDEKIYQGGFQVDEIASGWYPQLVLTNESGLFQRSGVLLRVRADGRTTLVQTINAVAKGDFHMRRFPFDSQRLEADFRVLGFGADEVALQVTPDESWREGVSIPQWGISSGAVTTGDRNGAPTLSLRLDVERESFYVRRLITMPLVLIVLLSFTVFWMDRSSLGDRLSVSFIGILTAVAYQMVMAGLLPPISYFTLMHGFLSLSFLTMCATVVVNIVVGKLDQRGRSGLGDRIDHVCRWAFPVGYFGLIGVLFAVTMTFF